MHCSCVHKFEAQSSTFGTSTSSDLKETLESSQQVFELLQLNRRILHREHLPPSIVPAIGQKPKNPKPASPPTHLALCALPDAA